MKRINGGEELAKEIGCDAEILKKTCKLSTISSSPKTDQKVDNHNHYAKNPGTDPFKKKFFHNSEWKMDDNFHVALMVSWSPPRSRPWLMIDPCLALHYGWSRDRYRLCCSRFEPESYSWAVCLW
jgi:hypothetical protein